MVKNGTLSLEEAARRNWDVIIVGTGMGGATLGYALARNGKQVLFCEKGKSLLLPDTGLRGDFAETFFARPSTPNEGHRDILLRAGRCAEQLVDLSGPRHSKEIPFIGCGTGGSTALYGGAMERFFPADFMPRKNYPLAEDSTLPEEWPISYEDILPYYDGAERLYRVRGGSDPFRPDSQSRELPSLPPIRTATQELNDLFSAKGLHPYPLPQACEFVPGCKGCQGFLCPRNCKNDSTRICLLPALKKYGACLLDECEVIRIEADKDTATGVVCNCRGQQAILRAETIVLAAGALATPGILLSSTTKDWPEGLANDSGLVGRNLMRHYVDLYALLPHTRTGHPGNLKELAFNDFYFVNGDKFGTVQSFGALPPATVIMEEMEKILHEGSLDWLIPLFKIGKPLLGLILSRVLTRRILFASIMEDLPYLDNRVMAPVTESTPPGRRMQIQYRITPAEQARIQSFRRRLRETLRPHRFLLIKQAENNERIAHACGTCRFGLTPRDSVLNATNRAHSVDNLYVVDASFFPSSAGTNPALTIAANALRVADHITGKTLQQQATAHREQ